MGQHFQRGVALFELQRFREAIEAFTEASKDEPDSPSALAMRAACWLNLGRTRWASNEIKEALRIDPEFAYSHYILCCIRRRQGLLEAAEAAIREALRFEQRASYYCQLAHIRFAQAQFLLCCDVLEIGLSLDPSHIDSWLLQAQAFSAIGEREKAKRCLNAALAINPESAEVHHARGELILGLGNATEAKDALQEARRLGPIEYNDRKALAKAYGRLLSPFGVIDRRLIRYSSWTPVKRWLLLAAISTTLLVLSVWVRTTLFLMPMYLFVFNALVAPVTLDSCAIVAGKFVFRRDLDIPISLLPFEVVRVVFVLLMHAGASALAVICAFHLVFAIFILGVVPNIELIWLRLRRSYFPDNLIACFFSVCAVCLPLGIGAGFLLDPVSLIGLFACWATAMVISFLLTYYLR